MLFSGRYDLSLYDGLELCIRGDGRPFIVNIQCPGLARKDDLWQTLMYTRGGVFWENIIVSEEDPLPHTACTCNFVLVGFYSCHFLSLC